MKIIERYVFGSFLSSFVLAFLVLSFVLTIGLLVQIIGFIMDGVPMSLVGEFCMVSLPETLQWSIPLALLVASVLVFSRLSADSEVAAMRACGINLYQVIRWPIIFALACTILGCFINNEIVPRGHLIRRTLKSRVSVGAGLSVLEPGRIIDDFPGVKIYFGSKDGNWLYDVIAYDYSNSKVDRMITADKALVSQEGSNVNLDLYQMTVDPLDENHPTMARFGRFVYTIKDVIKAGNYKPRLKDFGFVRVLREISDLSKAVDTAPGAIGEKGSLKNFFARELTEAQVELMKRLVFAMASVCFVLVGVPLGIRSQRKESSIGMAIALGVALGYYVVVILMLSLEKNVRFQPEWLIWLPVIVSFCLGIKFLRKHL